MRVRMKIREGVSRGLCGLCVNAQRTVDDRGDEHVRCFSYGKGTIITRKLVECSSYQEVGQLTRYEAEKIGWVLESKNGRLIGFKKPPKNDDDPILD